MKAKGSRKREPFLLFGQFIGVTGAIGVSGRGVDGVGSTCCTGGIDEASGAGAAVESGGLRSVPSVFRTSLGLTSFGLSAPVSELVAPGEGSAGLAGCGGAAIAGALA